jgi:hypothetical protein
MKFEMIAERLDQRLKDATNLPVPLTLFKIYPVKL